MVLKMKEKQAKFIKTKDSFTADNLKNSGFDLIDYSNDTWTFINNQNNLITFDKCKVVYSNILFI